MNDLYGVFDEWAYYARCIVCGDHMDYCQGHGEAGDSFWERHDDGDHSTCHSAACSERRLA